VAILSETAARRYFGDRSAVGRRLRPQSAPDAWIEIVGVVGDTRIQSLTEAPTPLLYYPLPVASVGRVWYLARAEGDPSMVATAMRGALREVAPALPVLEVGRLDRRMDATLGPMRVASLVLASFSAFALLLATTGIYAVVSMGVARRSAELGIRIALGAARRRVVAMVLGEVMVTVALGMVAGLAFAVLVAPRLSGFLFGVGGWDAMAFGVGAALLGAVAVAAAWIPARRAATADPVDALRAR
jgi:predicted lysophospholipase L1 biosynthesis ABC-type transport system permease subunit